jgi:hypothetical protein
MNQYKGPIEKLGRMLVFSILKQVILDLGKRTVKAGFTQVVSTQQCGQATLLIEVASSTAQTYYLKSVLKNDKFWFF